MFDVCVLSLVGLSLFFLLVDVRVLSLVGLSLFFLLVDVRVLSLALLDLPNSTIDVDVPPNGTKPPPPTVGDGASGATTGTKPGTPPSTPSDENATKEVDTAAEEMAAAARMKTKSRINQRSEIMNERRCSAKTNLENKEEKSEQVVRESKQLTKQWVKCCTDFRQKQLKLLKEENLDQRNEKQLKENKKLQIAAREAQKKKREKVNQKYTACQRAVKQAKLQVEKEELACAQFAVACDNLMSRQGQTKMVLVLVNGVLVWHPDNLVLPPIGLSYLSQHEV